MIEKYRDGVVPSLVRNEAHAADLRDTEAYVEAMDGHLLHAALDAVFRNVCAAIDYETQATWKLAKEPALAAELDETPATLARKLAVETVLLAPFMPRKAQSVWE